jgi:PhnB protein
VAMPLANMFWGDRYGKVVDPYGHGWTMGQHIRDMTPVEMKAAAAQFFANAPH